MVGAEWRKASRIYEAVQEKVRDGHFIEGSQYTAEMFKAWESLPDTFRKDIEKRIWDKQYAPIREQVNRDLDTKTKAYEQRRVAAHEAEKAANAKLTEANAEVAKLANMKTAIKFGMALKAFCAELGIEQRITWW